MSVVRPHQNNPARPILPSIGSTFSAFLAPFAAAPTADPGSIVASSTAPAAGQISVTLQNPTTVSRIPSAQARWEYTAIKDVLGNLIGADGIDLDDLVRVVIRAPSIVAPTDLVISAGLSAGAVNTTNKGICVSMQASAGSWLIHHGVNAGAGWALVAAATADPLTAIGVMQYLLGASNAQARLGAYAAAADLSPSAVSNTATVNAGYNSQGDYDRMFVGIGFATGAGGSAQTIQIGSSLTWIQPSRITSYGVT